MSQFDLMCVSGKMANFLSQLTQFVVLKQRMYAKKNDFKNTKMNMFL